MTSIDLYDFEGNIPDFIALAFAPLAGMNIATVNTTPNIQKPRPRCEITFRSITAAPGPRVMNVKGWGRVIGAYEGDLELDLITEPSAGGKSEHAAYRAAVRLEMELDRLRTAVNVNYSPYQIDFAMCTGAGDTYRTSDGYETSKLTYHIQFSIKVDAFNQLAAA